MTAIPDIPTLPLNDDTRFLEVEVRWGHTLVEVSRHREETEVVAGPRGFTLARREGQAWYAFDGQPIVDGQPRTVDNETHRYTLRTVSRSASIAVSPPADLPLANSVVTSAAAMGALVAFMLLVPISSHAKVSFDQRTTRAWVMASVTPNSVAKKTRSTSSTKSQPSARPTRRRPRGANAAELLSALSGAFPGTGTGGQLNAQLAAALSQLGPGVGHRGPSWPELGSRGPLGPRGKPGGLRGTESIGHNVGAVDCPTCRAETGSFIALNEHEPVVVIEDPPLVIGSIDKELIRRVIQENRAGIRHCYERSLQASPGLQGRVSVRFMINAQGKVVRAKSVEDTVGASVAGCLARKVRRLNFPEPKGGGVVVVTYPFLFRS